jgi:predicted dehydrogenase
MRRVGIVGAGNIGRWHAARWRQLPVTLIGFFDDQPELAEAARRTYGGQRFESLEVLLAEVDVLDVCTQTSDRKNMVLAAAAAGKAILCEKPMAFRLDDAQEMVDACIRAEVPLFVAHVVRFFPQFTRAKVMIETGQIGQPSLIRCVRSGNMPHTGNPDKPAADQESGGVVLDVAIHDIDYARWCLGEVERVFAYGLNLGLGGGDAIRRDHALITMLFSSGAVGHIESSWAQQPGQFRTRLEVAGDDGQLEWDSLQDRPVQLSTQDEGPANPTVTSQLSPQDDPYLRELTHFLDCLRMDVPFLVSPADSVMSLKIALATMASMQRGTPVDIATFNGIAP